MVSKRKLGPGHELSHACVCFGDIKAWRQEADKLPPSEEHSRCGLWATALRGKVASPKQFATVGTLEGNQKVAPQRRKPGCNENPWATTPMMAKRTA